MFDEHDNGQMRMGVPASDGPALASPALAELAGRYAVKCDDCREEIRRTDSVSESAAGGYCDSCKQDDRVVGPTRARLERKAARRREWAGSRAAKSNAAHDRAHELAGMIPFGQPILVGHHSEGRHRRDVARIEQNMRAAVDHTRKADEHESKADGLERQLRTSIYDDDPDAVEQLRAKIERLEEKRVAIKARPHASYELSNIGATIRNAKKRIEALERRAVIVEAGGRGIGRMMLARFASDCAGCGERIEKGSPIVYYKLVREAVHAACDERKEG